MSEFERLRAGGVELLVQSETTGLPRILHWGADLGPLADEELAALAAAAVPQVTSYVLDDPVPVAVLPEHALGYAGLPGVCGHRDGRDWSPLFEVTSLQRDDDAGTARLVVDAADAEAALTLRLELELTPSGLVRTRAVLSNSSPDQPYVVDSVSLTLPVPTVANELLDLTGRHLRERSPQRQPFHVGTRLRESRRGHGGHDMSLVLAAGTAGFGFRSGEVWAIHVGWSGNYRAYAERLPTGAAAVLGGGELLLPGEVRLAPGQSYESPWLYGSYGRHGLDEMAGRFHDYLRSRPAYPAKPRPILINTWEAVYFETDLDKLKGLASTAAAMGVERFVLDDGWFRYRRGEHAGLGDWYVDADIWPDGLHPLVDHVRGLGMEFGLWFEPESINLDSDLARAHPEWIFATGGRMPPASRLQQVLDVGHPEAFAYLLERIDSILSEYEISYIKWDFNRDLVDAGHSPGGEAGVRAQALAFYRLLDTLRERHPQLEIESCAGGGGRIDLGVLHRTDRVWTSDCNDALERQAIQRWTGLLVPPELMGAHIGPKHAHTTGRTHSLDFRAGTALFGHLGAELDVTVFSQGERDRVSAWFDLHKRLRPLLHSGRVVRSDHPDPALWLHGVVARDAREAVFSLVAMATAVTMPPGRVRLPGLQAELRYRIRLLPPADRVNPSRSPSPWLQAAASEDGLVLSGRALAEAGLQSPQLNPESLLLMHAEAVG